MEKRKWQTFSLSAPGQQAWWPPLSVLGILASRSSGKHSRRIKQFGVRLLKLRAETCKSSEQGRTANEHHDNN
jgi:hypothetical protein